MRTKNNIEDIQRLNSRYINNHFIGIMGNEALDGSYLSALKDLIDFNTIPLDVAKMIGMQKWDDDSDLYLFPYYLYDIIPNGLKVVSIFNEEESWDGKQDKDIRFGCLAYGLLIREETIASNLHNEFKEEK